VDTHSGRRRHPQARPAHDPIGLVLTARVEVEHHADVTATRSLVSVTDRAIIVAVSVGLTDRAVSRLLPRVDWRHPRGPRHVSPGCRIATTYRRLDQALEHGDLPISEADRRTVRRVLRLRTGAAYAASEYVRRICAALGITPIPTARCAAPGCDSTWTVSQSRRGGRPRQTCSDRCRRRLARHRDRARQRT
jgi:hypothetical protein